MLVSKEKTQKAFADKHGLNHKHLSQMLATLGKAGWRGVGNDIVDQLETDTQLKLGKGWFDATDVIEPLSAGIADSRPKNNVKALRLAIQSLFSVLHATQPKLASAVAEDIVETAGTEFVGQGFLNTLVHILRGDGQTSEAGLTTTPQAQVLPTSRRAVSAAK